MFPDELAFQLGLLGLACHSLYHAAMPKIQASKGCILMTSKDRLAYRSIFRAAGFSWQQFREISLQSMDWVTVEPGQLILDELEEDAVFWLYEGHVDVRHESELVQRLSPDDTSCLLGEQHLASLLAGRSAASTASSKSYVAGESGATLLRMDVPKLGRFLRHNDDMANNFGRLAFNSMQDRLNSLCFKTN